MSDSELFENLDVKQRIKKFSTGNQIDTNNNVSKTLLGIGKNNNVSRSMPDISTKKPPVPPKPKVTPNIFGNITLPQDAINTVIPKVPPDLNVPQLNIDSVNQSSQNRRKSPTPKPRPFTTDCTNSTKINGLIQNQLSNPPIPTLCIDSDITIEQTVNVFPYIKEDRVPSPKPQPKSQRLSAGFVNARDQIVKNDNTNKLISKKENLECDNDDVGNTLKSVIGISNLGITDNDRPNQSDSSKVTNMNKENVLKKLFAGPPCQALPTNPIHTKVDDRCSVPSPSPVDTKVENTSLSVSSSTSRKQRKTFNRNEQAYENNDIDPTRKNKIKNTESSVCDNTRNTLDGVIFGSNDGDKSDDDNEDAYSYTYEHSPVFRRKSDQKMPSNQSGLNLPIHQAEYPNEVKENIYEDPGVLKGFHEPPIIVHHVEMVVDSTYQDPHAVNFNGPQGCDYEEPDVIEVSLPKIPEHKGNVERKSSDSSDDYESPYEESGMSAPSPQDGNLDDYRITNNIKPPAVPSHKVLSKEKPSPILDRKIHGSKSSDSDDNDYDSPDESIVPPLHKNVGAYRPISTHNSHALVSHEDDCPEYTDPTMFYREAPKPQNNKNFPPIPSHQSSKQERSDDSDTPEYTDPSIFYREAPKPQKNQNAPPIPSHKSSKQERSNDSDTPEYTDPSILCSEAATRNRIISPPIPSHRISQNIRASDSSSDDDDPEYTDPTMFCSEPPVIPGSHKFRNGSIYQPVQYLPQNGIPSLDIDGEETSLDYTDPEIAFNTKSDDGEEIYSDEPLYQLYNEIVNKDIFLQNKRTDIGVLPDEQSDSLHFANFITGGEKSVRMLWAELPSVCHSGTLEYIAPKERNRQEAIFEVISSEASYIKSLDILVTHFMMSKEFLPNPNIPSLDPNEVQILDRHQYHFLFSGISAVKAVSERFLKDLRKRQQESVVFTTISDIILDYAKNHFNPYVKYCSNQVFQDRTLQSLKKHNIPFAEALQKLECDTKCQMLTMHSFLMLPMQRITRLPLLVDTICGFCAHGSEEFNNTDRALKAINSVVFSCNEGARKMERTEEMYFIQKTLEFKFKPIPLVSASRWLVKKGGITCSHEEGIMQRYKTQLRSIFKGKSPFYLFLFTDLIILTKMRSEDNFKVIDYCQRSMLKVEQFANVPEPELLRMGSQLMNPLKYAFTLIFLENVHNKTQEYHCFMEAESDITRWLEAINPLRGEIKGEAIYEEWDCPQVQVVHSYQAGQSDELSLIEGDIISVLRKLTDGWAEGLRLRDDEKGWFPINHTDEIDSKHMRAKNLMQRYRLLNASQNIVNQLSMK